MKKNSARPPRRRAIATGNRSVIYVFPAKRRQRRRPIQKSSDAQNERAIEATAGRVAGLLKKLPRLTSRRALLLGALACYALIIFNLIYGVAIISHPAKPAAAPSVRQNETPGNERPAAVFGALLLAGWCVPEVFFNQAPPTVMGAARVRARARAH